MDHINRIELQGRVGNVRMNEYNGSKVVNFSLVTELFYKTRDGGPMSETTWHNIVAWENREITDLHLIEKGAAVFVSGRLRSVKHTNQEGVEKTFYEVLASKLKFVNETTEIQ